MYHIVGEVERRGLPTEVVLLPIIESAFNPQAYSHAHASGMWQFIPSTGKNFGLSQDWLTDNRRDVLLSTNAALDYLTKLYGMFNSWELAFAAYNCGEGCVGRAIQRNQRLGLPTDFVNLKLPNETKDYVPKLLAVKNIILSPDSFGIFLPPVNNRPYFTQVKAPEKIDVKLAARLAEMTEESFAQLNPSFNKPVAATGTGFFLVPFEHADIFRSNLDLYRSLNGPMVSWTIVTAARGQTVDSVARKHGMTASYLRATNGPFKERKGKFTQPATFMAPNAKDAAAIIAAFDRKVALKREQQLAIAAQVPSLAATLGDDGPLIRSNLPRATRDNLLQATPVAAVIASPIPKPAAYVVKQGDTLFSIAKRSGIMLDALKITNQLTSNAVNVGQILLIPMSDSGANNVVAANAAAGDGALTITASPMLARVSSVPTLASTGSVAVVANRTKPASAPRVHIVRSGDTLFSIAKRFNTSIETLLALNKLSKKSALKIGARIKVSR